MRSLKRGGCGKATHITYSEYVYVLSYLACKVREPYYIVICGLSGSTIFFPKLFHEKKKNC
jgi:hypothetical protein